MVTSASCAAVRPTTGLCKHTHGRSRRLCKERRRRTQHPTGQVQSRASLIGLSFCPSFAPPSSSFTPPFVLHYRSRFSTDREESPPYSCLLMLTPRSRPSPSCLQCLTLHGICSTTVWGGREDLADAHALPTGSALNRVGSERSSPTPWLLCDAATGPGLVVLFLRTWLWFEFGFPCRPILCSWY